MKSTVTKVVETKAVCTQYESELEQYPVVLLLLLLSMRHTNQGVVVQIRERNTEVWLRKKTNHKKLS